MLTALSGAHFPATNMGWLEVTGIVLVATVIPVATFLAGLERIGPTNASMLSTLEPVVTVILAAVLFQDALKPLSKEPHDWYGSSLYMTPVDAYDAMLVMGLTTEAAEADQPRAASGGAGVGETVIPGAVPARRYPCTDSVHAIMFRSNV